MSDPHVISSGLTRLTFSIFAFLILPDTCESQTPTEAAVPTQARLEPPIATAGNLVDPFPKTYADSAVPLLQLPAQFRSRRSTANIAMPADQAVDVLNLRGTGCVRHLWFVFAEKQLEDLEIEINVDDAEVPQVRMPFR